MRLEGIVALATPCCEGRVRRFIHIRFRRKDRPNRFRVDGYRTICAPKVSRPKNVKKQGGLKMHLRSGVIRHRNNHCLNNRPIVITLNYLLVEMFLPLWERQRRGFRHGVIANMRKGTRKNPLGTPYVGHPDLYHCPDHGVIYDPCSTVCQIETHGKKCGKATTRIDEMPQAEDVNGLAEPEKTAKSAEQQSLEPGYALYTSDDARSEGNYAPGMNRMWFRTLHDAKAAAKEQCGRRVKWEWDDGEERYEGNPNPSDDRFGFTIYLEPEDGWPEDDKDALENDDDAPQQGDEDTALAVPVEAPASPPPATGLRHAEDAKVVAEPLPKIIWDDKRSELVAGRPCGSHHEVRPWRVGVH